MQVIVAKWGNSLGLRLPRAVADAIGVTEGQKVEVRADEGRIVVEPVRRRYTMEELMENVTPEAMREAFDEFAEWGEDVGNERVDE